MKKSNNRLLEIMLTVFISTLIGMVAGALAITTTNKVKSSDNYECNSNVSGIAAIDDMYAKIMGVYYEDIDSDKLVQAAIDGMLSILDVHSSYFDEGNATSFNNRMNGEYYGLGLEVMTVSNEGILVVNVLDDTAAKSAGIKENDLIIAVNGESFKDKEASDFTSLISRTEEELTLTIVRDSKEMEIKVTPKKVVVTSVTSNIYDKVGYIKISNFALNTAKQFKNELEKLENIGIESLIIDVRDNTGGYLSQADEILNMFLTKDSIMYQIKSSDDVTTYRDSTLDHRTYDIAILVNSNSASASEVLTAGLNENLGSKIVGVKTYGKGSVQSKYDLSEGTMVKLTTKKWLTPRGNCIDGVGISPTNEIVLDEEYIKNPIEENDNQLQEAIRILNK